jgi:isopenicillin-N epimerase
MQQHNWPQVAADCRQLAHSNYQRFCDLLGSQPLAPVNDTFLGQMCSIPINTAAPEQLQRLLYEQYKIEIPVMRQNERMLIRYSIQVFNSQQQLDLLYDSLTDIINTSALIKV